MMMQHANDDAVAWRSVAVLDAVYTWIEYDTWRAYQMVFVS